ncbi:hypothetical protein D3C73_817980 [compost metagenome]
MQNSKRERRQKDKQQLLADHAFHLPVIYAHFAQNGILQPFVRSLAQLLEINHTSKRENRNQGQKSAGEQHERRAFNLLGIHVCKRGVIGTRRLRDDGMHLLRQLFGPAGISNTIDFKRLLIRMLPQAPVSLI